jgi:hypothetical protein
VTEQHVPYTQVKADLEQRGLGDMVPRPPADVDVFRRVFSCGQRRKLATPDPDVTENLLIRQVTTTNERIVRRIVAEMVNQAGETLTFTEVAQVTYNSNHPDRLDLFQLSTNPHAQALLSELDFEYQRTRGCLDGNGIRTIISRTLASCSAVNLRGRSGGVYFVPEDQGPRLDQLEKWADSLQGANIHTLPLVDNRKQRDKIRSAVRAEMTSEIESIMAEVSELLARDGAISDRKFQSLNAEYLAAKAKVEKYNIIMEEQVLGASDRINILYLQMGELYGKVG